MDIRKILNQSYIHECDKNIKSCHRNNNYKREKRFRSAFTTDQIKNLEKEFKKFPYIGVVNRKEIAKTLNIPERAVKIWFQNRRMKEKKDVLQKEFHHYDQTGHNGIKFVNDQLNNVNALQSNNDLGLISKLPQTKSKTSLHKLSIDNFLKKNEKQVSNASPSDNTNVANGTTNNILVSPYFQNNTVTSSTNESNKTAEFSIQLLKKYKNHMHSNVTKKTSGQTNRSNVMSHTRQNVADRNTSKENRKEETCPKSSSHTTPTGMQQQHTFAQMPSEYVPLYTSNHYQQSCVSPGNILWKPIDPAEVASLMPMNDIALVSHTQPMPYPVQKHFNMQGNECFCNCHINHQPNPVGFTQKNQMPQAQYVIAIPFHKTPLRYSSLN